jgi:hypothetical protein
METGTPELECAKSGKNMEDEKCANCPNATIGPTDGDKKMATQGYRICKLARNEVERATYFRGESDCLWPGRVKK